MRMGVPVVDHLTGYMALTGILMALYARERTGKGQSVEATLFDAGLSLLVPHAANWFYSDRAPGFSAMRTRTSALRQVQGARRRVLSRRRQRRPVSATVRAHSSRPISRRSALYHQRAARIENRRGAARRARRHARVAARRSALPRPDGEGRAGRPGPFGAAGVLSGARRASRDASRGWRLPGNRRARKAFCYTRPTRDVGRRVSTSMQTQLLKYIMRRQQMKLLKTIGAALIALRVDDQRCERRAIRTSRYASSSRTRPAKGRTSPRAISQTNSRRAWVKTFSSITDPAPGPISEPMAAARAPRRRLHADDGHECHARHQPVPVRQHRL